MSTVPAFQMACPIVSLSHHLSAAAFELFLMNKVGLTVSDITKDAFFVRVRNIQKEDSLDAFTAAGQRQISLFLMSLNLATLGHFVWARNEQDIYPQFSVLDPTGKSRVKMVTRKPDSGFPDSERHTLTQEEVRRTALLFIALVDEPKSHVTEEYLKGIYHLGLQVFDLDFRKDAFANFYRSLEFFVTERVLGVTKLTNEKKEIQGAIEHLGFGTALAQEFVELYKIRGEQVMHAQRGQTELDRDSVLKMKVLADAVMNKVYQPVWRAKMEEGRARSTARS